MEYLSHSPEETEHIGEMLGRRLRPGTVVAYRGGLGMGKTAFTRGLARGLGCAGRGIIATFNLLDVREDDEWEINRLDGAVHIPLGSVLDDPSAAISQMHSGPVYVYCLGGVRSLKAAEAIADAGTTAISVDGGIRAWWTEIDPTMARY